MRVGARMPSQPVWSNVSKVRDSRYLAKILDNPLSLLTAGPMGALAMLTGSALNNDMPAQLVALVAVGPSMQNPQAAQKLLGTVANQHARLMFPGLF